MLIAKSAGSQFEGQAKGIPSKTSVQRLFKNGTFYVRLKGKGSIIDLPRSDA